VCSNFNSMGIVRRMGFNKGQKMNERIRLLARQADPGYTGNSEDGLGAALVGNDAIEKFAELIVRESSKWIVDNGTAEWRKDNLSPEFFAQRLLKHFGVEE